MASGARDDAIEVAAFNRDTNQLDFLDGGNAIDDVPALEIGDGGNRAGRFIEVDPGIISARRDTGSDTEPEPERRKRGRKPGTKNSASASKATDLSGAIAEGLFWLHTFSSAPEFRLSKDEATGLGSAFNDVLAAEDVKISKRSAAWVKLGFAVSGIYGGKFAAYKLRKSLENFKSPQSNITGSAAPIFQGTRQ